VVLDRLQAEMPVRPAFWYRTLVLLGVTVVLAELVSTVAIARLPDHDLWWWLGVLFLPFMAIVLASSLPFAWRLARTPA
jgi:hypothetical protein